MSTSTTAPRPVTAHRAAPLRGLVSVPGDKSISHRALMFGALAAGTTTIRGLLEADDVLNTARAVTALGAQAEKIGDQWRVRGRGVGGLSSPAGDLEFGNSGTGTRLMTGVIAGNAVTARMTGDASLSRRPMKRVLTPLLQMGLEVLDGRDTLPMTIRGTHDLVPIEYVSPVASAQVKSAILLAGLAAPGETTVIEAEATRDHTERMLRAFGATVTSATRDGKTAVTVKGHAELTGRPLQVPADPSSAAFLAAAAAIVPGSDVTITGVLANETRTGFYTTLAEMGGDVALLDQREENGEPIADIRVRHARLKGVVVPADRAPSMIDEYPILSVVAAFADGITTMHGLSELKVKESDRLAATADGLLANGIDARVEGDTLHVRGSERPRGGGTVTTHMDHRIAMAFLVLGLASDRPVRVDDITYVATSFPSFLPLMRELGATFN
jgi:3-phosphoshikimate 1-carboxyvinyltransferase